MNAYDMFLAIDLELNNARDGSTPNPKIIEVGVAWGSWDHYKDNALLGWNWYIDPQEPIYPEITQLTGIDDDIVKSSCLPHQHIATELAGIMERNNCFVNPITWGGGDVPALLSEFKQHGVQFNKFGRRWIDVKTWYAFVRMAQGVSHTGSLKSALPKFGLKFEGDAHRAQVDAKNTLKLFFAMLDRQGNIEYTLKQLKGIK